MKILFFLSLLFWLIAALLWKETDRPGDSIGPGILAFAASLVIAVVLSVVYAIVWFFS